MAGLSITTAWNEAAGFAQRNFGTLFTVAAALIVLPSVFAQAVAPAPGAAGGNPLPFFLSLIALALSFAGSLAISALATGRENVVGAGIRRAFRRLPVMLVFALLTILAAALILLPIVALSGLRPEDLLTPTPMPEAQRKMALIFTVFVLVVLPLAARLMVITPVAAAEDIGPLRSIGRSWRLTAGNFWKLLAFTVLIFLLTLVVMLVAQTVFGLAIAFLAGPIEHGSLAAVIHLLLVSLVTTALGVFVSCLIARIYVQLSGAGAASPAAGGTTTGI